MTSPLVFAWEKMTPFVVSKLQPSDPPSKPPTSFKKTYLHRREGWFLGFGVSGCPATSLHLFPFRSASKLYGVVAPYWPNHTPRLAAFPFDFFGDGDVVEIFRGAKE